MATEEIPDAKHLGWVIDSRRENQAATLRLYKLFETYKDEIHDPILSKKAQRLVGVAFSLWRAAFLADKTGKRTKVLSDARGFLAKMLTDNAISFQNDRNLREWAFNYYMNAATDSLALLAREWPSVTKELEKRGKKAKKVIRGKGIPSRRWESHHKAFVKALDAFEVELSKKTLASRTKQRRAP